MLGKVNVPLRAVEENMGGVFLASVDKQFTFLTFSINLKKSSFGFNDFFSYFVIEKCV